MGIFRGILGKSAKYAIKHKKARVRVRAYIIYKERAHARAFGKWIAKTKPLR